MSKKWTDEQKAEAKRKYAERIAKLDLIVEEALAEVPPVPPKEIEVVVAEPVKPVPTVAKATLVEAPLPTEYESRPMGMDYEHKIQSMTNAVKILPPNRIVDGRHLAENVQAICGFMVTEEMMDLVYKDYVHPDYN